MIVCFFIILAIFFIVRGTNEVYDDEKFWGWFILVGTLIIYIGVIFGNYSAIAKLKSEYISLNIQYKYIEQLPRVPMKNDGIDTVNFKLASQIVQQNINYWDKVQHYNTCILYWKSHPNLDLLLWGMPRIAPIIDKMPLITQKGE